MPCFILCPDCGENLGEVYDFIDLARQGFIKKIIFESKDFKEFSPDKMILNPDVVPPIKEILDAAELTNDCCRIHILGHTDFYMSYKETATSKTPSSV